MKPIEKSQRKTKMILQRSFVMICLILNGKTNDNPRSTAMKTTWLKDEVRENKIATLNENRSSRNSPQSSTRKSVSKEIIPPHKRTIEENMSATQRLSRIIPNTEVLCFLSRHMKNNCRKFAMRPRVPVVRDMLEKIVKKVIWLLLSILLYFHSLN